LVRCLKVPTIGASCFVGLSEGYKGVLGLSQHDPGCLERLNASRTRYIGVDATGVGEGYDMPEVKSRLPTHSRGISDHKRPYTTLIIWPLDQ
jgi:hypothetical protein